MRTAEIKEFREGMIAFCEKDSGGALMVEITKVTDSGKIQFEVANGNWTGVIGKDNITRHAHGEIDIGREDFREVLSVTTGEYSRWYMHALSTKPPVMDDAEFDQQQSAKKAEQMEAQPVGHVGAPIRNTKMNSMQMLDVSTGHLSLYTREWLEDPENLSKHGFMARDTGFAMSSYLGNVREVDSKGVPMDLIHVLRFAHLNNQDWVLFDVDAELDPNLPIYTDGELLPKLPDGIIYDDLKKTEFEKGVLLAVDPGRVSDVKLIIEPEPVLGDENFIVENDSGIWLTVGGASVRIKNFEDAGLTAITAFPKGLEMGEPVLRVEVTEDELDYARNEGDTPEM